MKRSFALIGSMAVLATTALAQNVEVIKSRQAIYKSMAAATKGPADMLKGAAPYDAKTVQAALDIDHEGPADMRKVRRPRWKTVHGLDTTSCVKNSPVVPDDSKTGEKTQALAGDLGHKDDFEARFVKIRRRSDRRKASDHRRGQLKTEAALTSKRCVELPGLSDEGPASPRTGVGPRRSRLASPRAGAGASVRARRSSLTRVSSWRVSVAATRSIEPRTSEPRRTAGGGPALGPALRPRLGPADPLFHWGLVALIVSAYLTRTYSKGRPSTGIASTATRSCPCYCSG